MENKCYLRKAITTALAANAMGAVLILLAFNSYCFAQNLEGGFNEKMSMWQLNFKALISALKVDSNILENSSNQELQITKSANEASISAKIQSEKNLAIYKATNDKSYLTGQGYNACRVVASNMISSDTEVASDKVRIAAKKIDEKWITQGSDASSFISASLENRKQYYCSPDERSINLCSSTRTQGFSAGDSDASIWLKNRSYGSEELATAADFIDVAAPMPTISNAGKNTQNTIEKIDVKRKAAFVSGARQVLYAIAIDGMEGEGNAAE